MQIRVKKEFVNQYQTKNFQRPSFQWIKVSGLLKSQLNNKPATKLHLQSSLGFQSPNNQDNKSKKKLNHIIRIDLQKSLHYENDVGWSWHKSSNLPNISIKVELRDQKGQQSYYPPQQTYARVFSVKMVFDNSDKQLKACLQDIGIKGNSLISLKNGCGVISGIRFLSTSYNNQGVKFYILIIIYGKNSSFSQQSKINTDEEFPSTNNIIASLLSPAIFVDSRKAARDYQGKKFFSFIELFNAKQIQRSLILKKAKIKKNSFNKLKKDSKNLVIDQSQEDQMLQQDQSENSNQIKIDNDIIGLYNYITAPNIRNKVKHPLFLNIKFSNAFKIFYNTKYYSEDLKMNAQAISKKKENTYLNNQSSSLVLSEVLKIFQRKIIRDVNNQRKTKKGGDTNKKSFIIKILTDNNNVSQRDKICQLLDFLNCKSILISDTDQKLNDYFVDITKLQTEKNNKGQKFTLLQVYVNILQALQKITKEEINLRTKNQVFQQQSQEDKIDYIMKDTKREKHQKRKIIKGMKNERMQKQNYRTQKKNLEKNNKTNHHNYHNHHNHHHHNNNHNVHHPHHQKEDSDDFFFDSQKYNDESDKKQHLEQNTHRAHTQKETYEPYAGNTNQVKKRIVDRNVQVKIMDPNSLNNQPPFRIQSNNNKKYSDYQSHSEDQVFLPPFKDQQYKNIIQFNDINDYFDFNHVPQKQKDKPVTRKLMQQKIQDQQKTIQVLTKILQDKVIEEKVNTSMAVAAINQATNLASQALLNNSLSNTLANNLSNTIGMGLNVVNPLTPLNSLAPLTMTNLASITPLTNLTPLNTIPALSQSIVHQTVITPSGLQLNSSPHFSRSNSLNNFSNPNFNSNSPSNIQIINQQPHIESNKNISAVIPQENISNILNNSNNKPLEIKQNQQLSEQNRAKLISIQKINQEVLNKLNPINMPPPPPPPPPITQSLQINNINKINNFINTNLLHQLQNSISNHQASQAKRLLKQKQVIQLNQRIIVDKKEHDQQIYRLKRQLYLQKSKNSTLNNQNDKKQGSSCNGLNLPNAPSITLNIQGIKRTLTPQFSVKIQKIGQQVHRIEIQNQIYRQKILNNQLLIQNLRKQLLKQQQK